MFGCEHSLTCHTPCYAQIDWTLTQIEGDVLVGSSHVLDFSASIAGDTTWHCLKKMEIKLSNGNPLPSFMTFDKPSWKLTIAPPLAEEP